MILNIMTISKMSYSTTTLSIVRIIKMWPNIMILSMMTIVKHYKIFIMTAL